MRVCHLIGSVDPQYGGPSTVMLHLAAAQCSLVDDLVVVSQEAPERLDSVRQFSREVTGPPEHSPGMRLKLVPVGGRLRRRAGLVLAKAASVELGQCDVFHTHGLWGLGNLWSLERAARSGVPTMIRPAGMLEPWCLAQKRRKKDAAIRLVYRRLLDAARVVHATAPEEAQNLRNLGLRAPIAVIPNGVPLPEIDRPRSRQRAEAAWPELRGKRVLLFLSRVQRKKGLLYLAKAWGELHRHHPDWHLVIAGPDEEGHLREVQSALASCKADRSTTLSGPVFGELKQDLYAAADLFVLPTFSENFGVVIAEALAAGCPVITTKGTPWSSLESSGCGRWIDVGVNPLIDALKQMMTLSDNERAQMGARGRQLVRRSYAWETIAARTVDVYRWILGAANRPPFVFFPGEVIETDLLDMPAQAA